MNRLDLLRKDKLIVVKMDKTEIRKMMSKKLSTMLLLILSRIQELKKEISFMSLQYLIQVIQKLGMNTIKTIRYSMIKWLNHKM